MPGCEQAAARYPFFKTFQFFSMDYYNNGGNYPVAQQPGNPLPYVQAPPQMILVQEEPRGPSQLIEIPVTSATQTRIPIPDIQQLRSQEGQVIIIKALRLIHDQVLTNAPTIGGINAPLAELQKMVLTLYCEGWEKGMFIPVLSLVDLFTEASGIPWKEKTVRFNDWRNVDWSKSYLQFANGLVPAGVPYSVILEAEYLRLDSQGKPIIGPK